MSKLQEVADRLFKEYPKEDKVFVTEDGLGFLSKNYAHLHANRKADKPLKVYSFDRTPVNSSDDTELDNLKKAELIEYAKQYNLELDSKLTKDEMLKAIKEYESKLTRD